MNGCDFKVYLIGGNGSTSVESFSGLTGFIQHIKKGIFSKDAPGTPIFCTFNHVKDNSPVSINFKFNVKKEPLYVELVHKPKLPIPTGRPVYSKIRGYGNIYVYFYRNKAKIPTIAPLICLLRSPKKKHIGSYIIPEKWRHVFHILYAK